MARDQIAGEWNRVVTSFEQTRRELEDSTLRIEEQFDAALAGIFRAHGMMLDGILSSGEIERELESLVGAEAAVRRLPPPAHPQVYGGVRPPPFAHAPAHASPRPPVP